MLLKLRNYINKSFGRRLLFFFVPFIVLLLASVTLLSFSSFFNTLKQEKEQSTRTLVAQISDNFDYSFRDIKTIMAYISINKDVQELVTQQRALSAQERYFLESRLRDALSNVNVFKNFINDVIIIGKNGYSSNLPNYYPLEPTFDLQDTPWLKAYRPVEHSNFGFTPPHKADYYAMDYPGRWVVSSILPITVQGRVVGYLQGDIDYERARALLDTVYNQNEIDITMVTPEGTIVFDRSIDRVNEQLDQKIVGQLVGIEGSFVSSSQGGNSLIVYRKSDVTGWYLIASIPYATLLTPGYTVSRTILLVIMPLSLIVGLVIFLLLYNQFKQPWSRLMHRMETVTVANYAPAQVDYGVGEIAELGNKFETMLAQNNQLIEQVYVSEIKKKNAELHALREQITPHFIYNSLQVIKADALALKNKQMSQTVTTIANLLRYSMSNGFPYVTVADEITYIRDYLDIYKRRFAGKFEYQLDVADEVLAYRMHKMLLQPIVENCIKHGFQRMKSGGCIQITGRRDGDACSFQVVDNGAGMPPEQVERLMQGLERVERGERDGIGLFNVHQRIVLEQGAGYGITEIDSVEGAYTRVVLRV